MGLDLLGRFLYLLFPFVVAPIGVFVIFTCLFQDGITMVKCFVPLVGFTVGLVICLRFLVKSGYFCGVNLAFRQLFLLFLLISLGAWKESHAKELWLFYSYVLLSSGYYFVAEFAVNFEGLCITPAKVAIDCLVATSIGMICFAGKVTDGLSLNFQQMIQPTIFSFQLLSCFGCIWFNHNEFISIPTLLTCYIYNKAVMMLQVVFFLYFRQCEFLFTALVSLQLCTASVCLPPPERILCFQLRWNES